MGTKNLHYVWPSEQQNIILLKDRQKVTNYRVSWFITKSLISPPFLEVSSV